MSITEQVASKYLGKKVEVSKGYDASLLVAIPRDDNRKQYDLNTDKLIFQGWDIWHAYEFSTLTQNGLPVTRVLKLKYSCDSEYLVESKSLKLYLNSFNMTRFGNCVEDCLKVCKSIIEKDLSQVLQTDVEVNFLDDKVVKSEIFEDFENILNYADENSLNIDSFKESPELLSVEVCEKEEKHYLKFDSLRSNCRVTHQPDFGDAFIYYKSKNHIKEDSLIKYLSSFRSEYHFHEECCEMIFKRLYDSLNDGDELFVCALYTRRGGIDICPARWTSKVDDIDKLLDLSILARNGIKQ